MTFQELSDYNDHYMLQEADWSSWGRRAAGTAAAAAAMYGGSQYTPTTPTPPTDRPAAVVQPANPQAVVDPIQDANFIAYIKNVENAASEGRSSNGVWVQHSSPEGGSDTFGYGHKIKRGEDFSQGRTDAQVDALLVDDLQAAENIVRREIGTDVYNKLDPKRKQMLIEFAFNLGTLRGFPLFTKAVIDNDIDVMRAEHHRKYEDKNTGKWIGLKRRNDLFHKYFLE